jgi:hypothetical protein
MKRTKREIEEADDSILDEDIYASPAKRNKTKVEKKETILISDDESTFNAWRNGDFTHKNYDEDWQPQVTTPTRNVRKPVRIKEDPEATYTPKKASTPKKPRTPKSMPKNVKDRLHRALSQRIYVINRKRVREFHHPEGSCEEFAILGSTGNAYATRIERRPNCNCPDGQKGNHCKHILYVMARVLRLEPTDHLIFQRQLDDSELNDVINAVPMGQVPVGELAAENVRAVHGALMGESITPNQVTQKPLAAHCCRICYEDFKTDGGELVYWCRVCGCNLHKDCWEKWSKSMTDMGQQAECIYCRTPNLGLTNQQPRANEGYMNYQDIQPGTSAVRDTSTYNPFAFNDYGSRF